MCWDIVEEEGQRVVGAGHVATRTSSVQMHPHVDGGHDAGLPVEKRPGGFEGMRGCDSSRCLYCQEECEENSCCRWGERWCAALLDPTNLPGERGEDGSTRSHLSQTTMIIGGDECVCREICALSVCDGDGDGICGTNSNNTTENASCGNGAGERRGAGRGARRGTRRREDIACGLEFGARGRLLASAGTSKQLKLYSVVDGMYSCGAVPADAVYNNNDWRRSVCCRESRTSEIDPCVRVHRLPSKLSSLAWNPGRAGQVSVGDYDGNVTTLDVESGHVVSEEDGHCGRRVWSVSYSVLRESCLASASDDGTVALWDARSMLVVSRLSRMAPSRESVPVTGVQFCPWDDGLVAVSATDSKGYIYDVRNMEMPVFVFRGHCRPLSYAKFLSRDTVVSAAIDSKIMAWNFKTGGIEATYTGHVNNKHFVGLSVGPKGVVACGSEDTRVYCYKRECPENPICYTPDRYLSGFQDHGDVFCSAVAWQSVEDGDCHVLASAFSDGSISMLGLH